MSIPSKRTIKKRLKELRSVIDNDPDPVAQRIAYGMETAIRWVIEDTSGWTPLAQDAKELAIMLRRELGLTPN